MMPTCPSCGRDYNPYWPSCPTCRKREPWKIRKWRIKYKTGSETKEVIIKASQRQEASYKAHKLGIYKGNLIGIFEIREAHR